MTMNTSIMNKLASSMALFALGSVLGLSGCIADSGVEDSEATENDTDPTEDVDSAEQAILGWAWTSEEYAPFACDGGALAKHFHCSGSNCDNISTYCEGLGGIPDSVYTTTYFSEEQGPMECDTGYWVTGMACSGSYCDNISLTCTRMANFGQHNCIWTGWVSEENGGDLWFPAGYYMRGARCNGGYCDNMSFEICQR